MLLEAPLLEPPWPWCAPPPPAPASPPNSRLRGVTSLPAFSGENSRRPACGRSDGGGSGGFSGGGRSVGTGEVASQLEEKGKEEREGE